MERNLIDIKTFTARPAGLFEPQWLLLTSGDFAASTPEKRCYNAMTISWGSLGVMWERPFAQVVVRPVRYTYEFMERFDTFTLCAFPKAYRKALSVLGSLSGRDGDKLASAGLTPIASQKVAAPGYAEAELIIECRKIYWQDFDPQHFLAPDIDRNYPDKDYHRIYYGEILAVYGTAAYTGPASMKSA
jgi:flavin reductase (DIM6/NTAB) family NADH-FMN oxidoreductase RutF